MSEAEDEDLLIRRYLLGTPTDAEREQLELRVLTDADFRDRVLASEDELIEDYADGALDARERHEFRRMFSSSPHRWRDVQVVEELKSHAARRAGVKVALTSLGRAWLEWLSLYRKPVFASVLVVAVAAVFFITYRATRYVPSAQEQRRARIEREFARLNSADARPPVAMAATLSPGLSRSDERRPAPAFPTVALAPDAESAPLSLALRPSGAGYESFQAALSPVGERVSYTVDLKPVELDGGARSLVLTLPARELDAGDYQVQLSGRASGGQIESLPDHYYYFRLARP
jgi:hypothetical protein